MSTKQAELLGNQIEFDYAESVAGYVTVAFRLITGWWFFMAGWGKLTAAEPFSAAGYLANAPAASPLQGFFAFAANTPWLLELTNFMIPVGETLIGLGLLVGALTRLAAFFGGFLMTMFYFGNASWSHGYVNGDLMGFMLFLFVGVFAAGRIMGLDSIIEDTQFVQQRPKLKYLLG